MYIYTHSLSFNPIYFQTMCTLHLDDCRQIRYTLPTLRSTSHLEPKIAQLVTYIFICLPQLKQQRYETTQYHILIEMDLGFRETSQYHFQIEMDLGFRETTQCHFLIEMDLGCRETTQYHFLIEMDLGFRETTQYHFLIEMDLGFRVYGYLVLYGDSYTYFAWPVLYGYLILLMTSSFRFF